MRIPFSIILIIFPFVIIAQSIIQLEKFNCSDCNINQVVDLEIYKDRVVDSSRIGDMYRIEIAIIANCGTGGYSAVELIGDTLILKYGIDDGAGYFCDCPFQFEYIISNVPKRKLHIKVYDDWKKYLGKREIFHSPHKYKTDFYEEGLTVEEYRSAFLDKIENEKIALAKVIEILNSILEYVENGNCNEKVISEMIMKYRDALIEGKGYRYKSIDYFIKDILGNEFVNKKKSELEYYYLQLSDEYNRLIDQLMNYGIEL